MADVADYLAAALEHTGAGVDRQDVGELHNVVARIRGTNSTGVTCGLVRCAPPPSAWASFGATEVVQHPCPIGELPGCLTVTDCWARGRTCWHIAQRSLPAADGPLELSVEGRPSGEPLQQPRQQRGPTTPNAARSAREAGPAPTDGPGPAWTDLALLRIRRSGLRVPPSAHQLCPHVDVAEHAKGPAPTLGGAFVVPEPAYPADQQPTHQPGLDEQPHAGRAHHRRLVRPAHSVRAVTPARCPAAIERLNLGGPCCESEVWGPTGMETGCDRGGGQSRGG